MSLAKLVFYSGGVYLSYGYYAVLQEKITSAHYRTDAGAEEFMFSYIKFYLLLQCIASVVVGSIMLAFSKQPPSGYQVLFGSSGGKGDTASVPFYKYLQAGVCYIGAMLASNAALRHINYPTQVIVKSCKMVPVMVTGVLLHGKRFSAAEYIRVVLVTVGIVLFTFFKNSAKPTGHNDVMGLMLAFLSLVLDGFVGPAQQQIKEEFEASPFQLMYYCNLWAGVIMAAALAFLGELLPAIELVISCTDLQYDLLQFAFLSAIGQVFIFRLITDFSALTLVTVTTTRKFFTILFSIFWFQHSVNGGQWVRIVLVLGGLAWESVQKALKKPSGGKPTKVKPTTKANPSHQD